MGHVSGLFVGFLFASHLLDWCDAYWTMCLLLWLAGAALWSLLLTSGLTVPCLVLAGNGEWLGGTAVRTQLDLPQELNDDLDRDDDLRLPMHGP